MAIATHKNYLQDNQRMINRIFLSAVVMAAVFAPTLLLAQPDNPNPPVPIDGGLVALAAAGAAYGVKKYRDSKK